MGHHLLLAHASAAKLYMNEYKSKQGGQIGLVVNMLWGGELQVLVRRVGQRTNFARTMLQRRSTSRPRVSSPWSMIVKIHFLTLPLVLPDTAAAEKFLAVYNGW